tara:strand:+ start:67 stop:213 length:147 start_codon:yes stop_codon:yes gene_type:complete
MCEKYLTIVRMEFIAPQTEEYFDRIEKLENTMDIRKLSHTNFTDLIAY